MNIKTKELYSLLTLLLLFNHSLWSEPVEAIDFSSNLGSSVYFKGKELPSTPKREKAESSVLAVRKAKPHKNTEKIKAVHAQPMKRIFQANTRSASTATDETLQYSEEAREINRLEKLEKVEIPIFNMPLDKALIYIADFAKMNFIAPPGGRFTQKITMRVHTNPYHLLKLLVDTYRVGLDFEDGVWKFYEINYNELITRTYKLKYNNLEEYNISVSDISGSLASNNSVESKTDTIVKEIQKILGLPTTGLEAKIEPGGSVSHFEKLSSPNVSGSNFSSLSSPEGKVVYISDNNELLVVATRQQHSYVEALLKAIDQPQKMIKIEALFVETSANPISEKGIDWTSASGRSVSLSGLAYNPFLEGGKAALLDGLTLTSNDMSVVLNFIETDGNTKVLQRPRAVTSNKKEVSLKAVTEEPIVVSSGVLSTGSSSTDSQDTEFKDIGTSINIVPQIMEGGVHGFNELSVQLNLTLVVSSQVGTKIIDGREFPIVAKREYKHTVIVPNGYTLAIGGLNENTHVESETKLPLLGDLPLIGNAFKTKRKEDRNKNLIAFITPMLLNESYFEKHDLKDQKRYSDFINLF